MIVKDFSVKGLPEEVLNQLSKKKRRDGDMTTDIIDTLLIHKGACMDVDNLLIAIWNACKKAVKRNSLGTTLTKLAKQGRVTKVSYGHYTYKVSE